MNRNVIIVIVLVVLVLLTAVQALQLTALKSKVSSGKLSVGTGSGTPVQSSGGVPQAVPSSIQDLPSMVGGC